MEPEVQVQEVKKQKTRSLGGCVKGAIKNLDAIKTSGKVLNEKQQAAYDLACAAMETLNILTLPKKKLKQLQESVSTPMETVQESEYVAPCSL